MLLTAAEERRLKEEGDLLKRLALEEQGEQYPDDEEAGRRRQRQRQEGQGRQQGQRRPRRWLPPFRSNSGSTAPEEEEDDDDDEEEEEQAGRSPPLLRPPTNGGRGPAVSSFLSPTGPSRLRRLLPALLLFLAVLLLLVTGGVLLAVYHGKLVRVSEWMQARAPMSALYFCGFMALWVALCLPSTPVELTAGFVFGFPLAFAALAVGKPLGCCIAFGLGRCIAADSLRDGLLKRAHGEVGPRFGEWVGCRRKWLTQTHVEHNNKNTQSPHNTKNKQGPDASRRARALFLAMERHPWKMTLLLRFMYLPIAFKVNK